MRGGPSLRRGPLEKRYGTVSFPRETKGERRSRFRLAPHSSWFLGGVDHAVSYVTLTTDRTLLYGDGMATTTTYEHGAARFTVDHRAHGVELTLTVDTLHSVYVVGGIPNHSGRGVHSSAYRDVPQSHAWHGDVPLSALVMGY